MRSRSGGELRVNVNDVQGESSAAITSVKSSRRDASSRTRTPASTRLFQLNVGAVIATNDKSA